MLKVGVALWCWTFDSGSPLGIYTRARNFRTKMKLDERVEELSDEDLRARIKTVERHALVGEQDFYEKRNAYKKRQNDTNLAFFVSAAETAVDRYARLQLLYKELVARLEKRSAG